MKNLPQGFPTTPILARKGVAFFARLLRRWPMIAPLTPLRRRWLEVFTGIQPVHTFWESNDLAFNDLPKALPEVLRKKGFALVPLSRCFTSVNLPCLRRVMAANIDLFPADRDVEEWIHGDNPNALGQLYDHRRSGIMSGFCRHAVEVFDRLYNMRSAFQDGRWENRLRQLPAEEVRLLRARLRSIGKPLDPATRRKISDILRRRHLFMPLEKEAFLRGASGHNGYTFGLADRRWEETRVAIFNKAVQKHFPGIRIAIT
jgi:hypothetical protein